MPLKLYLVRHGETPFNQQARYQGHHDSLLTPRGRQQAKFLAKRLARIKLDAAYSSDLRRARETAELALAGSGLRPIASPFWREVSYGRWEGLTYAEVRERWPAELKARYSKPATVAPSGGENMRQLRDRVLKGLQAIRAEHPNGSALVVSHGGALRTLLCHLLGVDLDHYWRLQIDHCSLSLVELHGSRPVVCFLNDIGHLDGLLAPESNTTLAGPGSPMG